MAIPGRIEEGLIQHRYGYSHDLPDYLEEAEIAMTVDTGGVFIGAPMFKAIDGRERSVSNIYPYHNIELLTEVSNNAEIIKIPFNIFNTSMNMPIVLIAYNPPSSEPALSESDIISINGIQIQIGASDIDINQKCNTINELLQQKSNDISCDVYNNRFKITFYSKQGKSLILDSITDQALQRFGFVNPADSNIIHKVVTPTKISSRSLGDILSDRISIKTFGTVNNSDDNCSVLTNAAIDLMYRNKTEYLKKDLFFPAGEYNYETDSIYLFSNSKIVGENNTKLTFKSKDLRYMISNTDIKGLNNQSSFYGTSEGNITNIELDNLIIQSYVGTNGIELYGVSDVRLNNVDIKSVGCDKVFSIQTTTGSGTYLKNISDILYDTGVISGGIRGISIEGTVYNKAKNIIIKNIKFDDISDSCIYLRYCENVIIEHCDFTSTSINKFLNIDYCTNVVIRDCSYPDDFILNQVENNKILMMHSSVFIDDYMYTTVSSEVNTPILALPNSKNELFNVALYYDVLSSEVVNRSGIITTYHYTYYSSERIRDNSLICDTSLRFTLRNGNNDNLLRIVCENDHNKVMLVRYKLAFNSLDSDYEYTIRGDEDTEKTDLPSWLPQGGSGGIDPAELERIWNAINSKQEILTESNQGPNIIIDEVENPAEPGTFITKISAIDTTYTAGTNITINGGEISAETDQQVWDEINTKQDKLSSSNQGSNITIEDVEDPEHPGVYITQISAKDTTYSAGTNIDISLNGEISATYTQGENISINNGIISAPDTLSNKQISNCVLKSNTVFVKNTTDGLLIDTGTNIYIPTGFNSGVTSYVKETVEQGILVPPMNIDSNSNCLLCYSRSEGKYFVKALSKFTSGRNIDPTTSTADYYYDNGNNLFKAKVNSSWVNYDISLPLAFIKTGSNHQVESITVFDKTGFIDKTLFVLPNIEVIIPNGRSENGELNNLKITKNDLTFLENETVSNDNVLVINANNDTCALGVRWIESSTKPTFSNDVTEFWYNPDSNLVYINNSDGLNETSSMLISRFKADNLVVSSQVATRVFRAEEYNEHKVIEANDWIASSGDYIWYRLYADGWVEQGGTLLKTTGSTLINLPIMMKGIVYTVTATALQGSASDSEAQTVNIFNKSRSSITLASRHGNTIQNNITIDWQVSGRYM